MTGGAHTIFWLAFAASLTACERPVGPPCQLDPAFQFNMPIPLADNDAIGVVGQPVTLDFDYETGGCEVRTDLIRLETMVDDPSNQPIAANATLTSGAPGVTRLEVTFTPSKPGPYHLFERFEPNRGSIQADLQVAAERRHDGVLAEVDQPCLLLDREGDTLICSAGLDAGVHVIVDGGTVQSLTGDTFAHAGSLLWVLAGTMLTPYRFDGNALTVAGETREMKQTLPQWLDAKGNQALALGTEQFNVLTLDADSGVVDVANPVAWPTSALFPKVHWVPGVAIDMQSSQGPSGCPVSLRGQPSGACFMPGNQTLERGANDDGIWNSVNDDTLALAVDGTDDGGRPYEVSVHLNTGVFGSDELFDFSAESTPFLATAQANFFPRFDGLSIRFQAFPPGAPHAQGNLIWYVESGLDAGTGMSALLPGRVRWFDR